MTTYGPTHLPDHIPPGIVITNNQAISEALDTLKFSGLNPVLRAVHTTRSGPAPQVSYRTILLLSIAFKIQAPKRDYLFTDLARWASTLTARQTARVELPAKWKYFHFAVAFQGLCDLLEPADSERRLNDDGTLVRPRRENLPTLDQFVNALVGASCKLAHWTKLLPVTRVQAMDSTDIESSAKSRAGTTEPDAPDQYKPDNAKPVEAWSEDAATWPRRGRLDGRSIISADPDARIGWRTRTLGRASNMFNGFDGHTCVDAGEPGSRFWVPVFRGVAVRPAGSYKAKAGLDLLDSLLGGIQFTHLAVDRGYSYARAEAWAVPVAARQLICVNDLHANQRRPHPTQSLPGAFWIDGSLFPDSLPQRLRKIPGFKVRSTQAEIEALRALYEERAGWAFVPNRRYDNGDIQYKGPARNGKLRCPNYAPSERYGAHIPRSNCVQGAPCACAATRVVAADEAAWERQRYVYGTTRWAAYYGLRNMVESQNAQLKHWRGSMRPRSTLLFGLTANTIVFALNCIAVNRSMLRDAYGEQIDPTADGYSRHDAPRRRRSSKTTPVHLRPRTTPGTKHAAPKAAGRMTRC